MTIAIDNQEYFFNTIIRKAHERVVTADDFRDFVGCHNWLLMEFENMSQSYRNHPMHPKCDVVTGFTLKRVFDNGNVEIIVDIGEPYHGGTVMHIPADELAIRMDAS